MFKKILVNSIFLIVIACAGSGDEEKTVKVKSLQENDKNLSCREILLEMNEAQFYNKVAHRSRGIKFMSVLLPLGYISTYMDSEKTIQAAKDRVEYLDGIYQIIHCEEREKELKKLPIYQPSSENKN